MLTLLRRILEKSRFLLLVAVIGSLLAGLVALAIGFYEVGSQVLSIGQNGFGSSKTAILYLIQAVDTFLLATVFLIIALGLFELFIDNTLRLPDWLEIRNLDDLKSKLLGVVVVVLAVLFLGHVAKWDGTADLLGFGVSIAAVIASLTWFLGQQKK